MVQNLKFGDVVQFNEKHEWCGCFGFINEVKKCNDDIRYMVGVQIPMQGTAFIFTMDSKEEIEFIGRALLVPAREVE